MAYNFDGVSKIISLTAVTTLDLQDLWSRWIDWLLTSDNSKYEIAFLAVWWQDINPSAWTSIPNYFFLANWWKIRPMESNHTLNVIWGILVDGTWDPFINTIWSYQVRINYQQPVQAITVSVWWGSGWGITASDVWNHPSRTLSTAGITAIQSWLALESTSQKIKAMTDIIP